MAEKETRDTTQDPTAEKGQLDTSELEAIVGGNDAEDQDQTRDPRLGDPNQPPAPDSRRAARPGTMTPGSPPV